MPKKNIKKEGKMLIVNLIYGKKKQKAEVELAAEEAFIQELLKKLS